MLSPKERFNQLPPWIRILCAIEIFALTSGCSLPFIHPASTQASQPSEPQRPAKENVPDNVIITQKPVNTPTMDATLAILFPPSNALPTEPPLYPATPTLYPQEFHPNQPLPAPDNQPQTSNNPNFLACFPVHKGDTAGGLLSANPDLLNASTHDYFRIRNGKIIDETPDWRTLNRVNVGDQVCVK